MTTLPGRKRKHYSGPVMMKPEKKNLTFIDKILLFFNCLLAAALLVSYLAAYVNPASFWVVAFFGLAYPPVIFANALMVVYWLLRKSRYLLLSVICIAVGYNTLLNNIGFKGSGNGDQPAKPGVLRVMTYNVHSFKRYGEAYDKSIKNDILQLIKQQDPDLLGIQEFYSKKQGEYDTLDSIKKIMNTPYCYYEIFGADAGIAIFSKYPITGHGWLQLSFKGSVNQCLYIDVERNKQKMRMYSIHLQSINFGPLDYKYLDEISKKGQTNVHATKRLGAKLKKAFLRRSEQVVLIKDHAAKCPHPYIIAGDFNDTPASYAVNQMAKGLKNAFREKGSGLGRTYNGSFPNYQIDYVMVSPQFDVNSYLIIPRKLSDHYPLQTDLLLK